MIQVQDTHRLKYRNAILRAFKLSDRTTRIDFYNGEITADNNIGATVRTSEGGYIMRSWSQEMVTCLTVAEDAVIQVSLDGGTSWEIEWVVRLETDPESVRGTDAKVLKFKGDDGKFRSEAVLLNKDVALPRYVTEAEYSSGEWAEGVIIVPEETDTDHPVGITKWTNLIIIDENVRGPISTTTENTGDTPSLRAGQTITVIVKPRTSSISMYVRSKTGTSPSVLTFGVGGLFIIHNDSSDNITADCVERVVPFGEYVSTVEVESSTENTTGNPNTGCYFDACHEFQPGQNIKAKINGSRLASKLVVGIPYPQPVWQYLSLNIEPYSFEPTQNSVALHVAFIDSKPELGEYVKSFELAKISGNVRSAGSATTHVAFAYRYTSNGLEFIPMVPISASAIASGDTSEIKFTSKYDALTDTQWM